MKKLFAMLLVGLLVLSGCGSNNEGDTDDTDTGTTYKVGTGVYVSVSATDAGEEDGKLESNVTYATVVLDGDKIKQVSIDTAQNSHVVKADGTTTFEAKKTKKELGDDYGMSKNGSVEWYKQIASLEEWLVGRTLAEAKGAADDADLASSVSLKTEPYIAALEKAVNNAVEVEGVAKLGSASLVDGSSDDGLEIATIVGAVALDADGKAVYTFIDESQVKATVSADGKVTADTSATATKGELKEDYGMSKDGKTEWYKQVESFVEWTKGKTVTEIKGASDDSDLASSVSISVSGFTSVIEKAATNAIEVK